MNLKIQNITKSKIITPILFFIVGLILFLNPNNAIRVTTLTIAAILFSLGLIRLINYVGNKKKGIVSNADLNYSVIIMSIGLFVGIFSGLIEVALRFLIGSWILFAGITRLMTSINMKTKYSNWIGHLIIAILMIAMGLYIIFVSNLVFSGIGLFIMFYALIDIVLFFMNKYKKEPKIIKNKRNSA